MDRFISISTDSGEVMKLWEASMNLKKAALGRLAELEDIGAPHDDIVSARFQVCYADKLESWFALTLGWGRREKME